ncbi:MAG TPA: AbrB/MazE/SpoVT family DNA-binding domain-containing protein [Microbacteriaceae bacterium]
MEAQIVKMGASQGVRIPKALLDEAGITNDVEITVIGDEIRITAAEPDSEATFMILSESALSDWERPEEDEARASLQ